jgi:hypothetical protein
MPWRNSQGGCRDPAHAESGFVVSKICRDVEAPRGAVQPRPRAPVSHIPAATPPLGRDYAAGWQTAVFRYCKIQSEGLDDNGFLFRLVIAIDWALHGLAASLE